QATFLVLSRKAASLRDRDAVGPWLYGVAYRLALKTRGQARKRPALTSLSLEAVAADSVDDLTVREAAWLLHEELSKLPALFRDPLILCYLEGQTRDEA